MKPLDLAGPVKPLLVSVGMAARMMGVRKRAIWEAIINGTLPSVVIEGERLIVYADLEAMIYRDSGSRLEEILRGQPQPDPFK